jgi:hypothetical protein
MAQSGARAIASPVCARDIDPPIFARTAGGLTNCSPLRFARTTWLLAWVIRHAAAPLDWERMTFRLRANEWRSVIAEKALRTPGSFLTACISEEFGCG